MPYAINIYADETSFRQQVSARLGNLPSQILTGSKTFDPPNVGNGAQTSTTVTVTGALLGQFALAAFSLDSQGIVITATVSAADTVRVTFRNDTGGSIDLGSGTLNAAAVVP